MIEKYSFYEFEIFQDFNELFSYKIFSDGCPPYDDGVIESDEWFDTEQEARFAVIGHITQLENGPDDTYHNYESETIDYNERRELGE